MGGEGWGRGKGEEEKGEREKGGGEEGEEGKRGDERKGEEERDGTVGVVNVESTINSSCQFYFL